jgi:hypothetical protein
MGEWLIRFDAKADIALGNTAPPAPQFRQIDQTWPEPS